MSSELDPSAMFCSFYNKISTIIADKHIPVKQLSKNERKLFSKPWITPAFTVNPGGWSLRLLRRPSLLRNIDDKPGTAKI